VRVLVVNAGSSTLKLRVLDGDDLVAVAETGPDDAAAIERLLAEHGPVDAAGHRVVHGGHRFVRPTVVDAEVLAGLEALVPLAPLHQPGALAGIRSVQAALPDVPSVACFDTAFHATIPAEASTYPVPAAWRDRFGLRRFGFHGLSHAYASRRAIELLGARAAHHTVTCHLGAGSSLTAVVDGSSVDTTMGFTPNEGIAMATRSGSVDVGMLTWLLSAGVTASDLEDGLQHRSGLLGLAGTADMREVLSRAASGDGTATLALDVWLHRAVQGIAAMAASAGGLDALVFTGGIGQRSAPVRRAVAERLAWLGVSLDDAANVHAVDGDMEVTAAGTPVRTLVIAAREDLEIARETRVALTC
jgi:acetate kinase